MNMKYIIPIKIIKRAVVDLPRDIFAWIRFYLNRGKNNDKSYAVLERDGAQPIYGVLDNSDLLLLEQVAEEYDLSAKLNQEGQMRGRVYSQGLIDVRLREITEKLRAIATKYLNSHSVKLELTYFQLSAPVDDIDSIPGGAFHMDDNKPNIKFFVYLCDVGEANGPFRVVPYSHGLKFNKLSRYIFWSLLKRRSNLYSGIDTCAQLDADSVKLVGEKGFCFVADTTAWHRADVVEAGRRLVFVASYNLS